MTDHGPRILTLRLDEDGDPLAGVIVDEAGRGEPFTGWLGLAAALGAHLDRGGPTTTIQSQGRTS